MCELMPIFTTIVSGKLLMWTQAYCALYKEQKNLIDVGNTCITLFWKIEIKMQKRIETESMKEI